VWLSTLVNVDSNRILTPSVTRKTLVTDMSTTTFLACVGRLTEGLVVGKGRGGRHSPARARTILKAELQGIPQAWPSLEPRDGIQFLERGSERVRETPDRARPEFLVLRLEVQIMHRARKMFGSLESALDERLVDNDFRVTSVSSLRCHASTCLRMGSKFRCIRSTPTEMQSMSEKDFECLASTGVKSPANAMFERTNTRYPQVIFSFGDDCSDGFMIRGH
jgi:hypothetical protein